MADQDGLDRIINRIATATPAVLKGIDLVCDSVLPLIPDTEPRSRAVLTAIRAACRVRQSTRRRNND